MYWQVLFNYLQYRQLGFSYSDSIVLRNLSNIGEKIENIFPWGHF